MHTVPTGRTPHEIVEIPDVGGCVHCAAPIDHAGRSWRQCGCAGGDGHRTYYCDECRGWTFDPPCSRYAQLDATGLDPAAAKQLHQSGPTADYGDMTASPGGAAQVREDAAKRAPGDERRERDETVE